jgi:hypothetical protein
MSDKKQTRRARRSFKKSGILKQGPVAEYNGKTQRVKLVKDNPAIRIGAAKGRDIPLPPSK